MSIEQEKMIVGALPSLYPLQEFEEKAIDTVLNAIPHWIPVEQALPKIGEYVFCETATGCFGKYCKHHVCKFVDKDKWIDRPHFDWDRNGFPHVIAWMPLPESFKGVAE